MKTPSPAGSVKGGALQSRVFAGALGAFFGICLLKFGNPPIMEKWVVAPADVIEFIIQFPWPISWAYLLLALVTGLGVWVAFTAPGRGASGNPRPSAIPVWLVVLPLIWLVWEFLASTQSIDTHQELTWPTFRHFLACIACFYLGFYALSREGRLNLFWVGLLGGFLVVLAVGLQQHFGGLEETRRYFFLYQYPAKQDIPAELLKKMSSDRIFSTLFYPNALAGAMLLLLPITLGVIANARSWFAPSARWFLVGAIGLAGLGCLYWSGSKGGWLLMLLLGLVALLRGPWPKQYRLALVSAVLLAGLAGFFWKYSGFFQQGATSVSARFDYWRAAFYTIGENPVFGTGPGTFYLAYQKVKRPESESSRLVHNDYLEQASDSGLPGFLFYTTFIVGALIYAWPPCGRRREMEQPELETSGSAACWVWLGVLGWALQGLLEFGLYIPALAWPAFGLLGWLLGRRQPG